MGKLNCGIIGSIVLGGLFIILGIFSKLQREIISSYVEFGFGTALLIWAIIKMALNIGMKCSLCPKCEGKLSWKEKKAFGKTRMGFLALRKASPCPGCQTVLIQSKWPYRIIQAAVWSLIAYTWLLIAFEDPTKRDNYLLLVPLFVFIIPIEIGMNTLRFEIVDEPKGEPG